MSCVTPCPSCGGPPCASCVAPCRAVLRGVVPGDAPRCVVVALQCAVCRCRVVPCRTARSDLRRDAPRIAGSFVRCESHCLHRVCGCAGGGVRVGTACGKRACRCRAVMRRVAHLVAWCVVPCHVVSCRVVSRRVAPCHVGLRCGMLRCAV